MSQGDDIEEMPSDEIEEALKDIELEKEHDKLERRVLKEHDIDFRQVRATDLKFNPRVNPPSEASKNSEAAILVQSNIIRKVINEYMSKTVEDSVLNPDEQLGKVSLAKRVNNGEIIITFTDKDGRVVVCKPSE